MTRSEWFTSGIAILVGLFLVSQVAVGQIAGQKIRTGRNFQPEKFTDAQVVEYKKKLNAILKTRLDEEKEFVDQVVDRIQTSQIPAKLVVSSWRWARNHRPDTKYPFVYFEHVLRLQATRIGLGDKVPPYDYGIYSKTNRPRKR